MFHATASRFATVTKQTPATKGAFGESWGWTRVGREALSLLARPLRPGQGIDGLEVSDSTYEEWEAVQVQFEARVRAGSVQVL
ncbi:hypothetical protein H5407_01100 [Mitsuaria sp. WAJ17]|uniref:hypothetical protein n=1 Tax=Mitsuaria sp. WAJ17 TaxID=2761452 RepID=UPI0015FF14CB|nr:hypothetical protein [Mitsuaria sp. WAJ17]MBB2483816.1 hypothetical protein [Mitsuaria sp. WAJ17]